MACRVSMRATAVSSSISPRAHSFMIAWASGPTSPSSMRAEAMLARTASVRRRCSSWEVVRESRLVTGVHGRIFGLQRLTLAGGRQPLLRGIVPCRSEFGRSVRIIASIDRQSAADSHQHKRRYKKPNLKVGHDLSPLSVQRVKRWITTPATNQPAATRK